MPGVSQSCDWEFGIAAGCRGDEQQGKNELARGSFEVVEDDGVAREDESSREVWTNRGLLVVVDVEGVTSLERSGLAGLRLDSELLVCAR